MDLITKVADSVYLAPRYRRIEKYASQAMQLQEQVLKWLINNLHLLGQQSFEATVNTYYLHAIVTDGTFAYTTNGCVDAWTISARC